MHSLPTSSAMQLRERTKKLSKNEKKIKLGGIIMNILQFALTFIACIVSRAVFRSLDMDPKISFLLSIFVALLISAAFIKIKN